MLNEGKRDGYKLHEKTHFFIKRYRNFIWKSYLSLILFKEISSRRFIEKKNYGNKLLKNLKGLKNQIFIAKQIKS